MRSAESIPAPRHVAPPRQRQAFTTYQDEMATHPIALQLPFTNLHLQRATNIEIGLY
jgi:hypothetical protein